MSYQSPQAPFRRTPTKSPVRPTFGPDSDYAALDLTLPSFHSNEKTIHTSQPHSKKKSFTVILAVATLCCLIYFLTLSPSENEFVALSTLRSKVSQSTEALKQLIPSQPFVASEPTPDFHAYAIAYLPLTKSNKCRRQGQITSDFASLEKSGRVKAIRLFSTDCKIIPAYLDYLKSRESKKRNENSPALKLVLGIEPSALENTSGLDSGTTSLDLLKKSVDAQIQDIVHSLNKSHISPDTFFQQVDLVVLGSEGLANQNYHPKDFVEILSYLRQQLDTISSHFRISITTSEPLGIWDVLTPKVRRENVKNVLGQHGHDNTKIVIPSDISGPTGLFCNSVDVVGLSVSPFLNPNVDAAHAGAEVEESAYLASLLCNKPVVAMEVGWPSAGSDNGNAKAGKKEQLQAISSITGVIERVSRKPLRSVLYQYFNDEWLPEEDDHARHYGLMQFF